MMILMLITVKDKDDKDKDDNRYDTIPNLQLLVGEQNKSKNDLGFEKWWGSIPNDEKKKYLFPENFNPSPDAFVDFFEKRKIMLKEVLAEKLGVSQKGKSPIREDISSHV